MEYLTEQPKKKQLVINIRKAGASISETERILDINRSTISKWSKKIKKKTKAAAPATSTN